MTALEAIRTWGLEKLGRYYAQYRAIVIDPKPDDKNIGNILVHIPRVQGGMKIIARSKTFKGGPEYGSKFFTPQVGEIVWVEFENGNPTYPLWSYHTWGENECPEELKDINTCGIVTPHGHRILIQEDTSGDSISILMDGGSSFVMKKDKIILNKGENKGLVNVESLRSFIEAVSKDFLIAKSGTNVSQWMAQEMATKLEDKSITH